MSATENNRVDESILLYCPACAGEYPLTFQICPAHGLPLTKRKLGVIAIAPSNAGIQIAERGGEQPSESELIETIIASDEAMPITQEETIGQPSLPPIQTVVRSEESFEESAASIRRPTRQGELFGYELAYLEEPGSDGAQSAERPGFRIAAIALVIALGIFAIVALYTIFSAGARRPSSDLNDADKEAAMLEPSPFIPTPQEARDYVEEEPGTAEPENTAPDKPTPEARPQRPSPQSTQGSGAAAPDPHRQTPQADPQPRPAPRRPVIDVSAPVPSQATDGRVYARLVRSRARKTPAGYRYDLTFNIQERAGRSMRWDRLNISSVSATGTRRDQTLPFPHYLGSSGMLTFTVSVEMAGNSEADWRGRIVCTGVGADNSGTPLRASFGATVAPW
ncbi:MAG: hypothetical protein L0229_29545 [Blastocatellia bacterium]|nr:hypothetical protein [Blastocatellia bacterium]